jgi:hypothetical protein
VIVRGGRGNNRPVWCRRRLLWYRGWIVNIRDVRAQRKVDAEFSFVARFVVVAGNSLPDLTGRYPDDRIGVAIVFSGAAEHFNTKYAFFEARSIVAERVLDQVPQKAGIPFAVSKGGASENPLELSENYIPLYTPR